MKRGYILFDLMVLNSLLTTENGSHSIRLTGSKKHLLIPSTDLPRKILLKELKTGALVRVLGETDLDQILNIVVESRIVQFPLDGSTNLYGTLILPLIITRIKILSYPRIWNARHSNSMEQMGVNMDHICPTRIYSIFNGYKRYDEEESHSRI